VLVFVSVCALMRIQAASLDRLGISAPSSRRSSGVRLAGLPERAHQRVAQPEREHLGYNWDPHQARIAVGNGGLASVKGS
jgi:hypothetical protein